ncbi:MAG TPA: hypothetical protein VEA69_11865 [Tepidisphaeraceae bacterium]|nr:hypothetical protein [Tepidisphaeraceae bacterium]
MSGGPSPIDPPGPVPLGYASPDDPAEVAAARARWRRYERIARASTGTVIFFGMAMAHFVPSTWAVLIGAVLAAVGLVGYGVWRLVGRLAKPKLIRRVRRQV